MSLNEYLQDRIDRRARENAPDEFSVLNAEKQFAAWMRLRRLVMDAVIDGYEDLRAVGLADLNIPSHVVGAAVVETLSDVILDHHAFNEAVAILEQSRKAAE
jgi:hypothetical protein